MAMNVKSSSSGIPPLLARPTEEAPKPTYVEESKSEAKKFWGAVGNQTTAIKKDISSATSSAVASGEQKLMDLKKTVTGHADGAMEGANRLWSKFSKAATTLYADAAKEVSADVAGSRANAGAVADSVIEGAKTATRVAVGTVALGVNATANAAAPHIDAAKKEIKAEIAAGKAALAHGRDVAVGTMTQAGENISDAGKKAAANAGAFTDAVVGTAGIAADNVTDAAKKATRVAVGTVALGVNATANAAAPHIDAAKKEIKAEIAAGKAALAHGRDVAVGTMTQAGENISDAGKAAMAKVDTANKALQGAAASTKRALNDTTDAAGQKIDAVKAQAVKLSDATAATAAEMRKSLGEFSDRADAKGGEVLGEFNRTHRAALMNGLSDLEVRAAALKKAGS